MPSLAKQYTGLHGIDLEHFPSEVTLSYGKDGGREWWEWRDDLRRKNRKGIVIQRANHEHPYLIFFADGECIRTLELPLTQEDKARGILAVTFGALSIQQAINALAELGIKAKLG